MVTVYAVACLYEGGTSGYPLVGLLVDDFRNLENSFCLGEIAVEVGDCDEAALSLFDSGEDEGATIDAVVW